MSLIGRTERFWSKTVKYYCKDNANAKIGTMSLEIKTFELHKFFTREGWSTLRKRKKNIFCEYLDTKWEDNVEGK